MDGVIEFMGEWAKKLFFVVVAVAFAILNALMLMDVFGGNILFVILGMAFFSIATWVYLVTAFGAKDPEKVSGAQVGLAWVGVIVSVLGEMAMAVFEILRMQKLVDVPDWLNMAIIAIIAFAMTFHLIIGIAYFASGRQYNGVLHKLFARDKKADADEKMQKDLAATELKIHREAMEETNELTQQMLLAATPVIAEQRAKEYAAQILRHLQLDANAEIHATMNDAIAQYRSRAQTSAMLAAKGRVIDAEAKDAQPAQPAATVKAAEADVNFTPRQTAGKS